MRENGNIVCVSCGAEASELYRIYGKNVMKLCECMTCGKLVDPYIEYDQILVFIDLLLQYTAAYRHLFVNKVYESFWRLACIFIICEAYRKWAIRMETYNKSVTEGFINLEWKFYECLVESSAEAAVFALSTLGLSLIFDLKTKFPLSSIFWITCCGFYGKIFVLFAVIWNLHHKWEYVCLVESFILISNYQTQNESPKVNVVVIVLSWIFSYGAGFYCHQAFDHVSYA